MSVQMVVFAVFDQKLGQYLNPFVAPNGPMAVRWFTRMVSDDEGDIGRFPEDYTLFELGRFDPVKGELISHSTPISIVKALSLKSRLAEVA